ncbi:hypothetical protein J6590_091448 [Homalodisca vitripennis]|nr:hypothetical protein J6590_091448 [Homalodisca vitripennis]
MDFEVTFVEQRKHQWKLKTAPWGTSTVTSAASTDSPQLSHTDLSKATPLTAIVVSFNRSIS